LFKPRPAPSSQAIKKPQPERRRSWRFPTDSGVAFAARHWTAPASAQDAGFKTFYSNGVPIPGEAGFLAQYHRLNWVSRWLAGVLDTDSMMPKSAPSGKFVHRNKAAG
jgi:hypothetical protein